MRIHKHEHINKQGEDKNSVKTKTEDQSSHNRGKTQAVKG